MDHRSAVLLASMLGPSIAGCLASPPPSGVEAAVVYGSDDRVDVYEAPTTYANIARGSVVALIETAKLDVSDPSHVVVRPEAGTLASRYAVCAGERFRDQPTAARCSGTLIDDDLVLTAGHCVRTLEECRVQYYVFGYAMDDATTLGDLTRADVFTCRDLVARAEVTVEGGHRVDYAIVQLDRPATPIFEVRPVDTIAPVAAASAVVVIGSGSGLPMKVDLGGTVRSANGVNSFFTDTDTFAGNSGSGVLRPDGTVIGILVMGRLDYVEDGTCQRVNVLPTSAGSFEEVTYAARAIGELCDPEGAGWRSARLCGPPATCGDGRCSGTETNATCRADCPAARCGDGVCQLGEDAACAMDCIPRTPFPTIPDGWHCPEGFYANHDGCHCECGAPDLDCDDTWQPLSGCGEDEFCSARSAVCIARGTNWTCPDTHYEDGACDCECGMLTDADCADPTLPRYACDDPPPAICSATPGRTNATFGIVLLVAAISVWAVLRRAGRVALRIGLSRRAYAAGGRGGRRDVASRSAARARRLSSRGSR